MESPATRGTGHVQTSFPLAPPHRASRSVTSSQRSTIFLSHEGRQASSSMPVSEWALLDVSATLAFADAPIRGQGQILESAPERLPCLPWLLEKIPGRVKTPRRLHGSVVWWIGFHAEAGVISVMSSNLSRGSVPVPLSDQDTTKPRCQFETRIPSLDNRGYLEECSSEENIHEERAIASGRKTR
jgi:hypothetical protein